MCILSTHLNNDLRLHVTIAPKGATVTSTLTLKLDDRDHIWMWERFNGRKYDCRVEKRITKYIITFGYHYV